MPIIRHAAFVLVALCLPSLGNSTVASDDFAKTVQPILTRYCVRCHNTDAPSGDVDFAAIRTAEDIDAAFETWEAVVEQLKAHTMPPEQELQPTDAERALVISWYQRFVDSVEPQPAVFRPRRLSVTEYRNTLRSLFGFDLQVTIIEAEQTLAERSLVVKLLPTDPPGNSGFKNDTHANPLTTVVWDQYSYLVDTAIEQLFSKERQTQLQAFTGELSHGEFTDEHAERLLRIFIRRAWRRAVPEQDITPFVARVRQAAPEQMIEVLKFELRTILMSPRFIYRGLLHSGAAGRRPVDAFELAERLSYFLWADMPDERLMVLAENGSLTDAHVLAAEVDRLITSPGGRQLAEVFASEWLTLSEIEHVSDNPPHMLALKSQPVDFLNYLFTEDRPLLELIDSQTAFINPHTARMYGRDAAQLTRYVRQKGIEIEAIPNQKIRLQHASERGGILTMPGILAMNKGPILRGTWILERVLGEPLPEPPANVGQVSPNRAGENLTFRQRFEQHRSNATCAVCHDRIDPLGFALQDFDNNGRYLRSRNNAPGKAVEQGRGSGDSGTAIDTSGQLPSGESFQNIAELKQILTTSRQEAVIRNIVEKTMSYALCRKLTIYDQPVVTSITRRMTESNGTWRDLFHAIVNSLPFRETIVLRDTSAEASDNTN
ncbi:MAG: DUF1592 domain-containing protein [Fuerstiella sp.]